MRGGASGTFEGYKETKYYPGNYSQHFSLIINTLLRFTLITFFLSFKLNGDINIHNLKPSSLSKFYN